VSVGLALSARDTILVLFSGAWSGASTPMVLISLAIGLGCIGYASGDAFKAAGRPGTLLWVNTASTVVMLAAFIVAAPHGITAVAAVHLATTAVYAVVRLGMANSLTGTTTADAIRAMDPALRVTLAIAVAALPVRLLLPAGPGALAAIVAAGLAGAAVGLLACGRETRAELWSTARSLRR
jgi:O-antigen/teichoic acid export membrane protein